MSACLVPTILATGAGPAAQSLVGQQVQANKPQDCWLFEIGLRNIKNINIRPKLLEYQNIFFKNQSFVQNIYN